MSSKTVISAAVASIHKEANFTSEMVTQGLMYESLNILQKQENWFKISMEDGSEGWIHTFYISKYETYSANTLVLTNRHTPLRSNRGRNNQIMALLSFGTIVPILEKTSGYCKIQLINGNEGFIPDQVVIDSCHRVDIVRLAYSLIGVPYIWGGKSSFGFDCSGFVQLVLKVAGILLPRDTGQQVGDKRLKEVSIDDVEMGDLVFFSNKNCINHVAFLAGDGKIIHCSGEVKLESIIEGEQGFNSTLAKQDHTFISISKMVSS